MTKKLSIAFIWHMHQPVYKNSMTGEYLMPWVRLHSVKDYLDMLLILDEYPEIRQTFNLVPSLIDQMNDYGFNDAHDIHSKLTIKDTEDLTSEEKLFILEHFFDANYANMISPHEPYRKLYDKRFLQDNVTIDSFSNQEYSDLLTWFNLIWFDPGWFHKIPELKKIYDKGCNYTLDDRKRIIEIQREIIRKIIPKYKELSEKGQIEISTSPYYHPILPLIVDINSAKRAIPEIILPENVTKFREDAKIQIIKGIQKFKEVFGKVPDGIWPSEQCVSNEALELMSELGIKWTVTDEGVLAKTLGKEFIRNFHGDLEDPYDLSNPYKVKINDKNIFVLFRDSILADLIGFEYGNHDPEIAANDLYERLKFIQNKLQSTPDKNHIVTIALDGENCWESYREDGRLFLNSLYKLLSEDKTLDITTVGDYLNKADTPKSLNTIHSGSWINRNFQLWIGDATKNLAWDYLKKTREELVHHTSMGHYPEKILKKAWEEIYIAEGSDWFWWFGEPNDSGQDHLFDELFRVHLQNVYKLLDKPIPEYLNIPLDLVIGKPSKSPSGLIRPEINGEIDSEEEWLHAGCIEIPQGPMYQSDKLVRRIFFGNDMEKMYFRFDINHFSESLTSCEFFIYLFVPSHHKALSPIRLRNKGNVTFPVQKCLYEYEIEIPMNSKNHPVLLSESIEGGLWKVKRMHGINHNFNNILEAAVPFSDIKAEKGQDIHFTITLSKNQILQDIIPQSKVLSIRMPY